MKKVNLRYPEYLKEFECIGGSCEDSCCIGWDIDIDKITFKKYFKVKDPEMKKMFQKNVHNNDYCTSDDVDYGKVKLRKDKRCPFLDEDNLCSIYKNCGEDYLSNVCTSYPRIMNCVDNQYEMSLDVACPEAARILLLKKDGIKFTKNDVNLSKFIISGYIDTSAKEFKKTAVKYFKKVRDLSIKILQNRKMTLEERLYVLGNFINELEYYIDCEYDKALDFIKRYDINDKEGYEKSDASYIFQLNLCKELLDSLNVFKEVDSDVFKEHTKEMIKGFKFEEFKNLAENAEFYKDAYRNYEHVITNNEYIFENYLVNFICNNLFPFSEDESMFNGYIMLLIRYTFIKFYLTGKYLVNKDEKVEDVAAFIQSFSKVLEHHKTFWMDTLGDVMNKEFDNMEFAKTIL